MALSSFPDDKPHVTVFLTQSMEQLIVGHKTKADSTLITLLLITVVLMLYNFIEKNIINTHTAKSMLANACYNS